MLRHFWLGAVSLIFTSGCLESSRCFGGTEWDGTACVFSICDACSADATCMATGGSVACVCNDGFTGDGETCTPVPPNPCDACADDATCVSQGGSSVCQCNNGFFGDGKTCAASPTVTLTVIEKPTAEAAPHQPVWVALQEGDGEYRLLKRTNGAFTFTVDDAAGRYALMVVCRAENGPTRVYDFRATVGEVPSPVLYCRPATAPETASISVAFENPGPPPVGSIALIGPEGFGPEGRSTGQPSIGRHDVFAFSYSEATNDLVRGLLLHDLDVADLMGVTFDFDTGFDFVDVTGTLIGTDPEDTAVRSDARVLTRERLTRTNVADTNGGTLQQVPEAALGSSDWNAMLVMADSNHGWRGLLRFSKAPTDVSVEAPPHITSWTMNANGIHWTGGPSPASVLCSAGLGDNRLLFVSAGWLGGATSVPPRADLSAVKGWNRDWEVGCGYLYLMTSNRSPTAFLDVVVGTTGASDGLEIGLSFR